MQGLYVHLPFCAQKCGYCNFVITLDRREDFRARFFRALEKETEHMVSRYGRLTFDTFYLGGGTPSLLTEEEMTQLIQKMRGAFQIKSGAEITCEFNPGDADRRKIEAFRDLGINRVSLGVQSFQESLIKRTGRLHSVKDIYETVRLLNEAGITNISFDLISGLPGQSFEDFRHSLKETIALGAKQLSFYDLEIHDNTPWGIERQNGKLEMLGEDGREKNFKLAAELLSSAGYVQYEVSTFAQPGFESRHNLIYWNNGNYLGLGPGAYSYLQGNRFQLAGNVGRYLFKCEAGDWIPDTSDVLTDEEKEIETLITRLRLPEGIRLKDFPIIASRLRPRIQFLVHEELLQETKGHISLTARGRALVESVFGYLIAKD